MANYTAPMGAPQIYNTDLMKVGEQYGTNIGKIASAVSSGFQEDKVNNYIQAYNNPNDTSIFSGITGSLRTEKLARLLLPINAELSATYQKKAQAEKADETQIERNMEVVNARKAVPTTQPNPDIDVEAINAEIALIVDALQSKSQLGNATAPQPTTSTTSPVDQTPVLPQAPVTPPTPVTPQAPIGGARYSVPPAPVGVQPSYIGAMNSMKMTGFTQPQVPTYGRTR